jgi:NAD(P)H-nitrite reductase large subunit
MKHVIIGNSAAGISATETIREHDEYADITIISDEPHNAYSRIFVPKYIGGQAIFKDLLMRKEGFYDEIRARAILGVKVEHVLVKEGKIELSHGKRVNFDNLLIFSGASPNIPNIPGVDLEGVSGLRTVDDANKILQRLERKRSVVIIGGGLVGIKAAEALLNKGVRITIVVSSGNIFSQRLDVGGSNIIQREMESQNVHVRLNSNATEIIGKKGVEGIQLDSGDRIECGLVIIGKGVSPNVNFLYSTGVEINRGVIVDSNQRTNFPNVFAAGDVAEAFDIAREEHSLNQMWANAVSQGRAAGLNAVGREWTYEGSLALNTGVFFGVPVAAVGMTKLDNGIYEEEVLYSNRNVYRKIIGHKGRIVGALLVGDVSGMGVFHFLIRQRGKVEEFRGFLGRRKLSYPHILNSLRHGSAPCRDK